MLAYTTGTINEPDAGSVGLTMAEQIRDDVASHAAWELVEEFTPVGGQVDWYVFKCLATESGLPEDFFVVMGRTLANGELRFALGEFYTEATNTLGGFPHWNCQPVYDAEGRNPATVVLDTNPLVQTGDHPKYNNWVPGGVSTKFWLIVADDGFTVAFNGAANAFVNLGAYIPLSALPIDLPLMIAGSSDTYGAINRNPAVAGVNSGAVYYMQYALTAYAGGGTDLQGPILGWQGGFRYPDRLQGDLMTVGEQGMQIYHGGAQEMPAFAGYALGKQKRMRVGNPPLPAGFAFGDAFALNGTLWVPYRPDDGRVWDTGVAA